jgi:methionine synthase II (cobalamin-independent)
VISLLIDAQDLNLDSIEHNQRVIAIARSGVEELDEVRDRLKAALDHIDPHRLLAAPDCGLGLLGRDLA